MRVLPLCREISEMTVIRWRLIPTADWIAKINRKLIGWSNYFCLGPVSPAYAAVDQHVRRTLRRWLCAKHKVRRGATARFPDQHLYEVLGLKRLSDRTRNFSWAKT